VAVVAVDSDTVGIGDGVAAALGELVGMGVVMLDSVGVVDTLDPVDGVIEAVDDGVTEAVNDGVVETLVAVDGVVEARWELAVDGVVETVDDGVTEAVDDAL